MWLFTKTGFYSVVFKPEDHARLTIRSRVRADLLALKRTYLPELSAIVTLKESDYQYRAFASRDALGRALTRIAADIDYPNFKEEVFREQGLARSSLYHRLWVVLLELCRRPRSPILPSLLAPARRLYGETEERAEYGLGDPFNGDIIDDDYGLPTDDANY
jgi:hypothetical protein